MTRTEGSPVPAYQPAVPTSGTAIAALVLAVASWVVLPVVPAVIALFLARRAKREVRASSGGLQGQSLATAATIVAAVNVGLFVLAVLLLVLVIVGPRLFM